MIRELYNSIFGPRKMKVVAIIYHKNALSIYKKEWLKECIESIKNQTFADFCVYELNYGDGNLNLCKRYKVKNYKFYNNKFDNHADAMNFLLKECIDSGIDVVFNNNIDDYNSLDRFEIQLSRIKEGFDIVSSNFRHIDRNGEHIKDMILSNLDISSQFRRDHNTICHPSVCYSRNFIKNNLYDSSEIPEEDFKLWKRTLNNYRFYICEEILVNYRIHGNQITSVTSTNSESDGVIAAESVVVSVNHIDEVSESEIIDKTVENKKENILSNGLQNKDNRSIRRLSRKSIPEFTVVTKPGIVKCVCGEPKDKIRYNFCQKCNRLY